MDELTEMEQLAESAMEDLEDVLLKTPLTTDQLGEFWLALTEQATLRLIRLRPEMVRHVHDN